MLHYFERGETGQHLSGYSVAELVKVGEGGDEETMRWLMVNPMEIMPILAMAIFDRLHSGFG